MALAAAAPALAPTGAFAAEIDEASNSIDAVLIYDGIPGERNVVKVEVVAGRYRFTESGGPLIQSFPAGTCSRVSAVQVDCDTVSSFGIAFEFWLEPDDGDDYVENSTGAISSIVGGPGDDVLIGGGAADSVIGGWGLGPDPGDDTMDGRGGADFFRGDEGTDTVTYASRTSPSKGVQADLQNDADDGYPGEGDRIGPYVENVTGSSGGDQVIGDHGRNVLRGGPGGDDLRGGGEYDELYGGDGSDSLFGEAGGDGLLGGNEGDRLAGDAGADVLEGEGGDDVLDGGTENDNMFGGPGTDQVDYSLRATPVSVKLDEFDTFGGNDGGAEDVGGALGHRDHVEGDVEELFGGSASDSLTGDDSDENLYGNGGTDVLDGAAGNDALIGLGASDDLNGGPGDDRLEGDDGNDQLKGGPNADAIVGGNGIDTVDYRGHFYFDGQTGEEFGVLVSLDGLANDGHDPVSPAAIDEPSAAPFTPENVAGSVERVIGSEGPDVLTGNGVDNQLFGLGGADVVGGGGGADTLNGGAGGDVLAGGASNDLLLGANDDDVLNPGTGEDTANGGRGVDTLTYAGRSDAVAVRLDGTANDGADPDRDGFSRAGEERDLDLGIENATGGTGPDTLYAVLANAVVNVLRGGAGNDRVKTRDGTATIDQAICGDGADEYDVDPSDRRFACESAVVVP